MKCRYCGSTDIYRSQRRGLREGVLMRLVLLAPFRCRHCEHRAAYFYRTRRRTGESRGPWSLASFIGFRGRDYKVRQWITAATVGAILLLAAIFILMRLAQN